MNELNTQLPQRFGGFFLYDLIGQGGMAEIFLAKSFTGLGTERQLVIKRILPHLTSRSSFGEMLIKEAKLCSRLSHVNVVQTYELGQINGLYYIAMEYVEGFDLNILLSMLSREKLTLPLEFALYIIKETLRGLDYAHRLTDEDGTPLSIIHRDISPTNILISVDGNVKICDFGIAKVALSDLGMDSLDDYHLKGKIAYMPPEFLNNETDRVDHRADLYGTGILLWELLMGTRLFKRSDEAETLRLAKAAEVPALENRGFPEFDQLNSIVERALSRDPDSRFQTGKAFIRAIEDYMYASSLMVSQLKFSQFIMDRFGQRLLEQRMERSRILDNMKEYVAKARSELDSVKERLDAKAADQEDVKKGSSSSNGILKTGKRVSQDKKRHPVMLVAFVILLLASAAFLARYLNLF